MNKERNKISFSHAIRLHLWAARKWWSIEPKLFISAILHAFISTLSPFATIYCSARIIDILSGSRNAEELWNWVGITLAVTTFSGICNAFLVRWVETLQGLMGDYEERMFNEKMLQMDFASIEADSTRDLLFEIRQFQMGNCYGFQKIPSWYTREIIRTVASIIGAIALTTSLFTQPVPEHAGTLTVMNHPLCNILMILILFFGAILSPLISLRSSKYNEIGWNYNNRYNRVLNTFGLLGFRRNRALDVRMYQQQDIAMDTLNEINPFQKGHPMMKLILGKRCPYSAAASMVSAGLIGIIYIFVCLKAYAGAFGVGYITQYVGAITSLCNGLSLIFMMLGDLPNNARFLRAIKDFMDIPNDMYQGSLTTEKRADRNYEVEFKDVSFKYPGSESYALRHVSMKFKISGRLAVVGMNGSGKTTFIKLLCRLYDPTEGQILLNGIDIRKYRYDDYLNIFSVVFQDFQLAALPLGENVAASAEYDKDRVIDALKKSGFGDRLVTLPNGLDTYLYHELNEDGVSISGGEAQKIAIARALYKDAPFIILDEPTAALDPIAEAEIYSKFDAIAGDKTAIYISHRLSSCRFCDDILVFHEGNVIQQGTHDTLVADTAGKYYELWNAQAQYYT
ncbi:MAG: ABC transporter ATP-binding protein [Agathobacter sp.]|nr:ABC transporter ATP-binding protein [Agathobacter sp.]